MSKCTIKAWRKSDLNTFHHRHVPCISGRGEAAISPNAHAHRPLSNTRSGAGNAVTSLIQLVEAGLCIHVSNAHSH